MPWLDPIIKSLKQRLIDNSAESKKIVEEDKLILSELLQSYDKDYFNKLVSFFQWESNLAQILENVNTLNEFLFGDYFRFFALDTITMWKKQIHNNKVLLFSSEFSSKFSNKKHCFGNYKVKVDLTRSVKTPGKSLKKTFKNIWLDLESIVDIEFFEYRHEEENLNFTDLDVETISFLANKYWVIVDWRETPTYLLNKIIYSQLNLDYKDEKTLLEMIKFYTDKEKVHIQFWVFVANNIKKYLPLYVWIWTNEPYWIKSKWITQKERYFIADLLTNNIQFEHRIKFTSSNLKDFFTYIRFNKKFSLLYEPDSYEYLPNWNHSITFNLVDANTKRFIKFYNIEINIINDKTQLWLISLLDNICNWLQTIQLVNNDAINQESATLSFQINNKNTIVASLIKNNTYKTSIYRVFVSEVVVESKSFILNQIEQIKTMIQPSWSNASYLLNLLTNTDKYYSKYFRLKHYPHKVVADLDCSKALIHLNKSKWNFYNYITDSQWDLQYSNFAQMWEDFEQISWLDNRLKYINILLWSFIANWDLDSIVLDPETFVKSHKLLNPLM